LGYLLAQHILLLIPLPLWDLAEWIDRQHVIGDTAALGAVPGKQWRLTDVEMAADCLKALFVWATDLV
jgi:hypothetical protein